MTEYTANSIQPLTAIMLLGFETFSIDEIEPKNNFREFDQYYLDVTSPKKRTYVLSYRADYLQSLCSINVSPKGIIIKYGTDYKLMYSKNLLSSTLSKKPIKLDDLDQMIEHDQIEVLHDDLLQLINICIFLQESITK